MKSQCRAFTWRILSETGDRVPSSAKVVFDPDLRSAMPPISTICSCSASHRQLRGSQGRRGQLRRLARHGTAVWAGSAAGFSLLCARACWTGTDVGALVLRGGVREEFPDLPTADNVIVLDRPRYTVSGAAAAFDLMLGLSRTARRRGDDRGRLLVPASRGAGRGCAARKCPTFRPKAPPTCCPRRWQGDRHVCRTYRRSDRRSPMWQSSWRLAATAGTQFKSATGQSPSRYYRTCRMNAARQLVLYSNDTMTRYRAGGGLCVRATPMMRHYRRHLASPRRMNATRSTVPRRR